MLHQYRLQTGDMLKLILLSVLTILVLTEDLVLQPRYLEDVPQTRVVGGEVARPHSWPWQVSLQVQSGRTFFHTCGGSLIRTGWVMTAAHCVDRPRTWRVVLGEHNLDSNEGTEQIISVREAFVHQQWNPNSISSGFDIALLQLSTEATLNTAVQLAVLPPSDQILPNNNLCYITGWGLTSSGGSLSNSLKQAYLPIVDLQTCSSPAWWGSGVKPTMICAGGRFNSGCQGDSGGPLNCQVGGRYYVHGVTSFGPAARCNTFRKPTVFTRVSAYTDWINNIIG
ncbi:elastase-1-like [Esox lucius]|uniref:pancreatic elastase n=1 Tax=Esox lucius TaxID=8010 RepID=A0A3P8YJD8_ESOLU|nr:elastase-1-like [Esox lucius]